MGPVGGAKRDCIGMSSSRFGDSQPATNQGGNADSSGPSTLA